MSINPVIIYGFNEGNLDYMLSSNILEEYNMAKYMTFMSQSYSKPEIIYGFECELQLSGKISFNEQEKKQVEELYKIFMENKHDNYPSKLGYYLCISGEIEYWNYESYSLNEDNEDDDNDDE